MALPTPQMLCRLSARHVSQGSAGTSLALQLLNPLQRPACCAHALHMWPGHVSGGSLCPRTCQHVCPRESTGPAPATPPSFRLPEIPSPLWETHRDRSLIHIFLLGADFSSRGEGQSDSSISGGLREDSSMLSSVYGTEEETAPRLSSAPSWQTRAPGPAPSTCGWQGPARPGSLRLPASPPELQFLRLLLSSSRALGSQSELSAPPPRAAGAASSLLSSSPGGPLPLSPPFSSACRLVSLLAASHSPSRRNAWQPGAQGDGSAQGRARTQAPGAGGCVCLARVDMSAC